MSDSIRPIIGELEKARDGLIRHFLKRGIAFPAPVVQAVGSAIVTVEAKGRKRYGGGYYQAATWRSQAGEVAAVLAAQAGGSNRTIKEDQITIYSETLAEPINVILTELGHQVAHGLIRRATLPCSTWHDRYWARQLGALGMDADMEEDSRRGFAKITPSPALLKVFDRLKIDRSVFDKYRMAVKREDKGSNLRKYVCPCDQIIRVTNPRWPGATCNKCRGVYGMPKDQVEIMGPGNRKHYVRKGSQS